MHIARIIRNRTLAAVAVSAVLFAGPTFAADHLSGQVVVGGAPMAKSTIILWAASANAPKKLAEAKSNDDGKFEIRDPGHGDSIVYLVATGGEPKAKGGKVITLRSSSWPCWGTSHRKKLSSTSSQL